MKTIYAFFFLLISGSLHHLGAQVAIEKKLSMSLGPQNAYYVEIPGAEKKLAEKTFEEFVKEYGKLKENGKARESFMLSTKIPAINGSSPVDLYVKFEDGKDLATTYVWVDLGGAFVTSVENPSQSEGLKQFMRDYFIAVRKKVVSEELKNEEKRLGGLEKELHKLRDKNDDFKHDIEKARQKIAEAEKNIEKNNADQLAKVKEIDSQKVTVGKVTEKLNNLGKKE